MLINLFLAATPECWLLLIFGVGYSVGFVLYIMVQFDSNYEKRNQRDWHYTTWLVALPAVIGFSQRFHPKYGPLRIFYGFILIMMIFIWQIALYLGVRFIKVPVQRPQVSTRAEIIDWEYHLAGVPEVLGLISFDNRVNCLKNNLILLDKPRIEPFQSIKLLKLQSHCTLFSFSVQKIAN